MGKVGAWCYFLFFEMREMERIKKKPQTFGTFSMRQQPKNHHYIHFWALTFCLSVDEYFIRQNSPVNFLKFTGDAFLLLIIKMFNDCFLPPHLLRIQTNTNVLLLEPPQTSQSQMVCKFQKSENKTQTFHICQKKETPNNHLHSLPNGDWIDFQQSNCSKNLEK